MKLPTFSNEYFDKLKLSEYSDYLKSLRAHLNLDRADLSKLTGLSIHTIRRYESTWENSKPPKWYELLMRFMCGDLSFFGPYWINCTISHDKKLASPYFPHDRLSPLDMHVQHNRIHSQISNENRRLNDELNRLKNRIAALEAELESQQLRIELLTAENERLKSHGQSVKSGKVLELFANQ